MKKNISKIFQRCKSIRVITNIVCFTLEDVTRRWKTLNIALFVLRKFCNGSDAEFGVRSIDELFFQFVNVP